MKATAPPSPPGNGLWLFLLLPLRFTVILAVVQPVSRWPAPHLPLVPAVWKALGPASRITSTHR